MTLGVRKVKQYRLSPGKQMQEKKVKRFFVAGKPSLEQRIYFMGDHASRSSQQIQTISQSCGLHCVDMNAWSVKK